MKVLAIATNFEANSGGVATFVHNICLQLNSLGHRVDALAPWMDRCAETDISQRYRVYRFLTWRHLSSLPPLWDILRLHRQNQYDIVFIGHLMTTHAIGSLILHKLWCVPYVILSHGNDLYYAMTHWIDNPVGHQLLCNASLLLSNSQTTAERIRMLGYQRPVGILHPGVNINEFRPSIDTLEVLRRYNLSERKVIFSVSRLVKRKGHQNVLRALSIVIKKIPNVVYLIAGRGEEEPLLIRIVNDLGLNRHVLFAGHVPQKILPALYCACDLFVMPSFERDNGRDYEGFGIVYTEANACGKPVIGGRSGGTADAVVDGETGLLVDPHDVDAIASAIIQLLTNDELARQLGENGLRRVEQELSWEKVGERISSFLEGVVDKVKERGSDRV